MRGKCERERERERERVLLTWKEKRGRETFNPNGIGHYSIKLTKPRSRTFEFFASKLSKFL